MTWAEPGWLFAVPLVGLLGALLAAAAAIYRRRLASVLSATMMRRVVPGAVRGRRAVRDVTALVGMALLAVALSEPRFGKVLQTIRSTGTDLVILLDVSRSMDARDVDPSRLERARREVTDLGDLLEGDRVGLVLFAGGAFPRLPLTADMGAIEMVVREADTSQFSTQGSDLASAIRVALELLSHNEDDAGRALLVLSDGETHDADDALAAAQEAARAGVTVFAMGIGVDPSPVPLGDGRNLRWKGEEVVSTPDFTVLEQVARETGGAFVQSKASNADMRSLYGEIRSTVRAVERESQQRQTWESSFQWPLGFGLLALLVAGWIGEGRRRYGAATVALLVALGGAAVVPAPAHAQDLLEADRLYREGKYDAAVRDLVELSLAHPDDAALQERLGAARYRAGDAEGAVRAFEAAGRLRGEGATDTWFNSANANYKAGRLEKAVELYDRVLAADPDHASAKQNRDLVSQEIAARRAEQPPPPPPQDQGGDPEDQPTPSEAGGEPQEAEPSGDEGEEPAGDPSAEPPPSDPSDPTGSVAPDDLDGPESEGPPPSDADGTPGPEDGPITEGQARQLLDGVEEGQPRTVVQGEPEGKPW